MVTEKACDHFYIEKRKRDLIDINIEYTTQCWLKSINQETNTQENVILGFDEDYYIF